MQSSPYKIKALKEQFWQLSWHLAPLRTFFCFSTQANSKNNHDWSPAEFVLQMPWKALQNLSPTLQIHLFQSSVLPSLPKILTHGIKQVLSTQFLSLSHRVKLLLFHSFWLFYPRESMSWEKKKKSWNCSVVRRTETIWVAAVEFSVWYGSKSLVPFPVLTFLFSRCLMLIFKVTDMEALEKVWLLTFFYILFFPVCF